MTTYTGQVKGATIGGNSLKVTVEAENANKAKELMKAAYGDRVAHVHRK
jgi:hypothetical protein